MSLSHEMYSQEVKERGGQGPEVAIETAYRRGYFQGAFEALQATRKGADQDPGPTNVMETWIDVLHDWRYFLHAGKFEAPPSAPQGPADPNF